MSVRPAIRDESFAHAWQAVMLERPLPVFHGQQYVYPQAVEEIERGALQLLLRAQPGDAPVMMTFALGFADPSLPHGVWSCPNPSQLCAVAGGYAYIVRADEPAEWTQAPYRPVVTVHPAVEQQLLVFAGFHKLWALGAAGHAWETSRLSWEGLRVTEISGQQLQGFGWDMATDKEVAFTVDLATGRHSGGAAPK